MTLPSTLLLLLLGATGGYYAYQEEAVKQPLEQASEPQKSTHQSNASQIVSEAFQQQKSKLWVEIEAPVIKLLPDDNKGSRHQRFILRINAQHTILVAHNIDLAPRVPLNVDDVIQLRGRYEYNQKGGVLHWTHADPNHKIAGGWIRHRGKKYL